jgi:hypothetical protein
MVVDVIARFDPKGALRVKDLIKGHNQHNASVSAVERVSKYSYEQALAIFDAVEPNYSYTKAVLLGILGNSLATHEKEKARELLSRVPRYIQSDGFLYPLHEAVKVLSGEIARSNIDQGIALVEQYLTLWSEEEVLKGIHLVDVASCAAEHDVERAIHLASQITDGFVLAKVLLAIARHSFAREERLSALQKASTTLINEGVYNFSLHGHLLAEIALEMAPLAPWDTLDLVKHIPRDTEQRVLKATLQAILDEEIPIVESTNGTLQPLVEHLYQAGLDKRKRFEIFTALFSLLDPVQIYSMLEWLETRDVSLSLLLCGWYVMESDPDAALGFFAAAGEKSGFRGEVIVRAAARFPDHALELYHQGHEEPEVLAVAIGVIAQRDSTRALALAATEPWEYQLHRWKALAEVAVVVAKSDWQQALGIIQPISDVSWRRITLSRIVAALPQDLPPGAIALVITRLTTEAGDLRNPDDRLDVYESLIGFLQDSLHSSSSATAALIEAIGLEDSGVFFQLLPDLIRLVCKDDRRMPFSLEAEPAIVKTLLDA